MHATIAAVPSPKAAHLLRVLTWRFVRNGSGVLGSMLAITCGVPVMLYGLLWIADPEVARLMVENPGPQRHSFAIGEWLALPSMMLIVCANVRGLYVLPVTNRFLVNTQLTLGMALVAAVHLLTALFYRVGFNGAIPGVGPLLVLCPMVVIAAGLATLLFDFRWWKPFVVAGIVLTGLGYVVDRAVDPLVAATSSGWLTPTPAEALFLFLVAPIGYWLTLRGVTRDRCGELRAWPDLDAILHRLGAMVRRPWRAQIAATPFRSPTSAHFWFEFWQKGLLLPLMVSVGGGLSLAVTCGTSGNWLRGLTEGFPVLLMFGMFLSGLIAGILNLGIEGQGMAMIQYRATRPVSDAQQGNAVIKAALASVLLSALIVAGLALIVSGWLMLQTAPGGQSLRMSYDPFPTMLIVCAVGWSTMGLVASLMMAGRAWLIAVPWFLAVRGFLAQPLMARLSLSHSTIESLRQTGLGAITLLVTGAAIATYIVALRQGVISRKMLATGGILWIVSAAVVWFAASGLDGVAVPLHAIVGLTSLVAAPLATAPLALSWNRHR